SQQPIYPVALRTNITPWKYPQVQKWSAGIQYDFGHSLGAEVTYVGTKSTHLIGVLDLNQINPNPEVASGAISPNAVRPFPGFSSMTARETNGSEIYNGLQTSMKRRVGAGLSFQVSSALSKTVTGESDM